MDIQSRIDEFPYPREDFWGSNFDPSKAETVPAEFPSPLEDIGGSNQPMGLLRKKNFLFPSPPEDFLGLTVLGQNIVQLFFRFRPLARILGVLTKMALVSIKLTKFPYPREDLGGTNKYENFYHWICGVSVPSRGLGGSNLKNFDPNMYQDKFPSPREV